MAETQTRNLPARRTHEALPPDAPEDLLGYYETVIDESVAVAESEQHRAWLALDQIHEHELWRLSGHRSFSAYLEERWDQHRVTAYRQIAWARAARELPGIEDPTDDAEVVARATTLAEEAAAEKKAAAAAKAAARRASIDAASQVMEPTPGNEGTATEPTVVEPEPSPDPELDPDPDPKPEPKPEPAPKPSAEKPVQLSLFDVPTGDLLGELRNRLFDAEDEDRAALVTELRALLAAIPKPRTATNERCSCTPTEFRPSKAASNVCANCRKVRVR